MERVPSLRSYRYLHLLYSLLDCYCAHHSKLLLSNDGVNTCSYRSGLAAWAILEALRGFGHPRHPRLGPQAWENDNNSACLSEEEHLTLSVDPAN